MVYKRDRILNFKTGKLGNVIYYVNIKDIIEDDLDVFIRKVGSNSGVARCYYL